MSTNANVILKSIVTFSEIALLAAVIKGATAPSKGEISVEEQIRLKKLQNKHIKEQRRKAEEKRRQKEAKLKEKIYNIPMNVIARAAYDEAYKMKAKKELESYENEIIDIIQKYNEEG